MNKQDKEAAYKISFLSVTIVVLLVVIVFGLFFLMNPSTQTEPIKNSIVVFETSLGIVKIELFEEQMPITAGNFRTLVENKFYDGSRFHRVIEGFMVQGGDPNSKDIELIAQWGTGGPGYTIEDEFVEGLSNVRGTLSMANTGQPNSGGSQFFINVVDNTFLDFDKQPTTSKHPVFGQVIEGMGVVDAIVSVETTGQPSNRPVEDVFIEKAYIE